MMLNYLKKFSSPTPFLNHSNTLLFQKPSIKETESPAWLTTNRVTGATQTHDFSKLSSRCPAVPLEIADELTLYDLKRFLYIGIHADILFYNFAY
jgi:hypothetical protein